MHVLNRGTDVSPSFPYCFYYTTHQGGLMLRYWHAGRPVKTQHPALGAMETMANFSERLFAWGPGVPGESRAVPHPFSDR